MTDHDTYCAVVAAQVGALADLLDGAGLHLDGAGLHLDGAGLGTPVPTTPGWDVQGVVKHLGVIQRWAAQMIRDGMTERLDFKAIDGRAPADGQSWADWLRTGGDLVVGQLRAHAADTPVWTWGPGGTVGWWARRLTFETFVHAADIELALGATPELAPELAVDGVDEFLANLAAAASFAPSVAELRGDGETIHLHATDAEGEWMIALTPDGFRVEHGHGKGDVAVRGPAAELLLLVYGRRTPADASLECFGDTAVLERWRAQTAI